MVFVLKIVFDKIHIFLDTVGGTFYKEMIFLVVISFY